MRRLRRLMSAFNNDMPEATSRALCLNMYDLGVLVTCMNISWLEEIISSAEDMKAQFWQRFLLHSPQAARTTSYEGVYGKTPQDLVYLRVSDILIAAPNKSSRERVCSNVLLWRTYWDVMP